MKLMLIAGARPNFMKIAPIIHAIERRPQVEYCLVHTGQHYDDRMSEIFFRQLGIPKPNINLDVGSGSHAVQTASIMTRFEEVCIKDRPDWVVVVGDVNSTMACTLVASKMGIKVAHVEAGLRSFDRSMPEEINRLVTDALADLLLTPSEDASENLRKEGVSDDRIELVGNIMIDTLVANLDHAEESRLPEELEIEASEFAYVTLHRPANVDTKESLETIMTELKTLSKRIPVVFPMHPRSRKKCEEFNISLSDEKQFHVVEPIGYHDSIHLTRNARVVVTDSGGLQEESTYFCTPCLTLRPNTERPVTIEVGSNKLTQLSTLESDIDGVLNGPQRRGAIPHYWDGNTAHRILTAIENAHHSCEQ